VAEVKSRRWLRSAATAALIVPATARSKMGDRAFSVAVAQAWNSLPLSVTSSASLPVFRKHHKTALFPVIATLSTLYIVTLFHSAVLRVFILYVLVYGGFMYRGLAVLRLNTTLILDYSFLHYIYIIDDFVFQTHVR